MNKFLTFVLFLFLIVQGIGAEEVEHRLIPVDDTYTYSDNTIRGMEDLLKTYHSTAGAQFRRITFLKFDISSLSPFAQSVKLRLYTNGFQAGGDNAHQFDLYPVKINTWSEDDITFLNFTEKAGTDMTSPVLASYIVPAGQALPAQYIEFSGANLTRYITDSLAAGKQYVSIRLREKNVVKNGAAGVIVEFHSKENESGFTPELIVVEKDVELLRASDIRVDGVRIEGFSESVYRYVCRLPYNTTVIPDVSATAKYGDTSVSVTQAAGLTGTEASRTAKIRISKGEDMLTYSIVFELLPPPNDARLSDMLINGKSLEFFDKEKTAYVVYLPYSAEEVPEITVVPNEPGAVTRIENALSVDSSSPESERTTNLYATSGDKTETRIYRVEFRRLPKLDIILGIGQSNMAGRADFSAYTGAMQDVFLLTPAGEFENASNPMNKYSNIRKDISLQKLGPSYSCALKLQEYMHKPVAFVVNAQGGSSITTWYQPGKSNYDASVVRAKEAQRFGRIRGVIWHQGESDSGNAGTYMEKLKTMVENLRKDLNEPDLYFVAGELAYWRGGGTGSTAFNTMIRTIAANIPNSDWISAEGCTPLIDNSDPHFDAPSAILLGERYAEKLIGAVFNTTATDQPEQIKLPLLKHHAGGLTVVTHQDPVWLKITDLTGRSVYQHLLQAHQSVDLKVNKGIYLLSFRQNEQHYTRKIMIQ